MNAETERYHVQRAVRIITQFIWLLERLYEARPDLRPEPEPQAVQPSLFEEVAHA